MRDFPQDFPDPWPYAEGATGFLPVIPGQTFTGRERLLRPLPIPVVALGAAEAAPGDADPWAVNPNQSALDVFTLYHLGLGALLRQLGLGLAGAMAVSLAWEWWIEPAWKVRRPDLFPVPGQDSTINRLTDTVAVGLGWWFAGKFAGR